MQSILCCKYTKMIVLCVFRSIVMLIIVNAHNSPTKILLAIYADATPRDIPNWFIPTSIPLFFAGEISLT